MIWFQSLYWHQWYECKIATFTLQTPQSTVTTLQAEKLCHAHNVDFSKIFTAVVMNKEICCVWAGRKEGRKCPLHACRCEISKRGLHPFASLVQWEQTPWEREALMLIIASENSCAEPWQPDANSWKNFLSPGCPCCLLPGPFFFWCLCVCVWLLFDEGAAAFCSQHTQNKRR